MDVRGFERGTFTNANRNSMSGGVAFYQDWDLEGSGNWTRFDDNARVETQNHTDFNEINQRTVSSQNATPTHDKNGNMTDTGFSVVGGQNFPGGKRRLEFDALNRVRKVYDNNNTTTTSDDTLLAEYIYDCGNRRLQKVVTNSGSLNGTTRFYYLGWRVMEERDGSDAILQQYTYGNYLDEVWTRDDRRSSITVAQLNDGSGTHRMFLHYNTLFHVYGLTDEAGALKEAYQYDAYGKQTVITDGNDGDAIVNFSANDVRTAGGNSTFTNPYMFTGQRFDPETGIMYYKMRYYSFDMGRFLSRDPIGGMFLYEYCSDNPIGRLDGLGLQDTAGQPASGAKQPPTQITTEAEFRQLLKLTGKLSDCEIEDAVRKWKAQQSNAGGPGMRSPYASGFNIPPDQPYNGWQVAGQFVVDMAPGTGILQSIGGKEWITQKPIDDDAALWHWVGEFPVFEVFRYWKQFKTAAKVADDVPKKVHTPDPAPAPAHTPALQPQTGVGAARNPHYVSRNHPAHFNKMTPDELRKTADSLDEQVKIHEEKIAKRIGFGKVSDDPIIQKAADEGRVRHLQKEIRNFKEQAAEARWLAGELEKK